MAIAYIHPATQERVEKEPWYWVAFYKDGTSLHQFELSSAGAVFHQSKEIDTPRLERLELAHKLYPSIHIAVPNGAEPVHFYRHRQIVEEFKDSETGEMMNRAWRIKIWCIGFRIDKQFWLAYADEYGNVVFSNDNNMFLDKTTPGGAK